MLYPLSYEGKRGLSPRIGGVHPYGRLLAILRLPIGSDVVVEVAGIEPASSVRLSRQFSSSLPRKAEGAHPLLRRVIPGRLSSLSCTTKGTDKLRNACRLSTTRVLRRSQEALGSAGFDHVFCCPVT